MDPFLSIDFSPYYPPDDPEGVLPLEEDALNWLDSITFLSQSSPDTSTTSPDIQPLFDLSPSGSSTSPSAASRSPEHHSELGSSNGNDASDEESSSSSESPHGGKKARISLDPHQPLTVKGKPRARVYVACRECRNRKVRCDGAKPVCFNCSKRDPTVEACDYDAAPKRRGQDKVPGSRTRSAVGQRAPRRAQVADNLEDSGQHPAHGHSPRVNLEEIIQGFDPATFDPEDVAIYELAAPRPLSPAKEEQDREQEGAVEDLIASVPSMRFARETWWDALLVLYASHEADGPIIALTADQRLTTTKRVFADIRAVLNASVYWASFLHLPRFFETILEPNRRNSVQPSLLLSMLAIGIHSQSSEIMQGAKGRARAQQLIDLADSAIQASLSSNWVDIGLVQAAWFMAYFEMQGHSRHNWDRCQGTLRLLDSLIRLLSLTTLDAERPEAHYSIFATYARSMGSSAGHPMINDHTGTHTHARPFPPPEGNGEPETIDIGLGIHIPGRPRGSVPRCACMRYTLKEQWPTVCEVAPLWGKTAMWPDGLLEGEIQKEECRRLVWSSVMLSAGQNAYTSADAELDRTELFIKDYRNFALLFPGEQLCLSAMGHSWQSNVWNLCLRAMILWNTSVRQRGNATLTPQARAEYAMNAWLEADAIEAALNLHTCYLEESMLYQTREFLFTARMCVSHEFRLYAPQVTSLGIMSLYREKAEQWLQVQMTVSEYLWRTSQSEVDCEMVKRPLLCYWFMGHIVRALILFKSDPTLLLALDAAKVHIRPLEYLMRLWPCDDQRQKWAILRRELVQACLMAGVPPPTSAVPAPFEGVARRTPTSVTAPQT